MDFLTRKITLAAAAEFGTPLYVYDEAALRARAGAVLAFPSAFGCAARYAMKALPTAAVLRVFTDAGLDIDASSGYEAERAMRAGVAPGRIQITAQELPKDLAELVRRGVKFNASSLRQLRVYGGLFPGSSISVRINPGLGSGHNNRTNVGGPSSSFGIWREDLDEALAVADEFGLRLTEMHTHVGSGSDVEMWLRCASLSLDIAARLPEVRKLSLGGGFKVGRMPGEISADLAAIGAELKRAFEEFARAHGRELGLEIEPGTYLVAGAGALICRVDDVADTGPEGYRFIKVDSGMTEMLRPSMYGAQHPMALVAQSEEAREPGEYLVVGHCCESGDILTPAPGNPEGLQPRTLPGPRIGDLVVIGGAGAYCASMAAKNYNSFPECAEAMLTQDGELQLIRKRQTLEQIVQNEILPGDQA